MGEGLEDLLVILPPFTLWSVARFPGGLALNLVILAGIAYLAGFIGIALWSEMSDRRKWGGSTGGDGGGIA